MKTVILERQYLPDSTIGTWSTDGFIRKTLELPNLDNQAQISCIPEGEYVVKWTQSPRMSKEADTPVFTYEILNVPKRGGIRIHPANYTRQLRGCIALGRSTLDIDKDGIIDVSESKKTVNEFETFMNREDFKLIIKS